MDSFDLRLELLPRGVDHFTYPLQNCPTAEPDIHHLDLILSNFQAQRNHIDPGNQSFTVKAFDKDPNSAFSPILWFPGSLLTLSVTVAAPGDVVEMPNQGLLRFLRGPVFQRIKSKEFKFL